MNGQPVRYLLDANVFIEATHRYYAFDIVPAFWDALIQHGQAGSILSIDRVKDEITHGKDDLADWVNGSFHALFASTNEQDVIIAYGGLMRWANAQQQYTLAAKAEFARADNADAWLIAYAQVRNCLVVTHEQLSPSARARILIPNVCSAFNVQYVDTFQMLRALGIRLG